MQSTIRTRSSSTRPTLLPSVRLFVTVFEAVGRPIGAAGEARQHQHHQHQAPRLAAARHRPRPWGPVATRSPAQSMMSVSRRPTRSAASARPPSRGRERRAGAFGQRGGSRSSKDVTAIWPPERSTAAPPIMRHPDHQVARELLRPARRGREHVTGEDLPADRRRHDVRIIKPTQMSSARSISEAIRSARARHARRWPRAIETWQGLSVERARRSLRRLGSWRPRRRVRGTPSASSAQARAKRRAVDADELHASGL